MNEITLFDSLTGRRISRVEKGHGSFLTVECSDVNSNRSPIYIWVYLANWAFLKGNEEIFSSDSENIESNVEKYQEDICHIINDIVKLDDEIHIVLDKGISLEVWPYDDHKEGDSLLLFYRNDKLIYEITV